MIRSKKQMLIIIGVFALVLFLGGSTYAWFNYSRESANNELIAGDIYMHFNEGNNTINLTNVFPETKEEARARNDNFLTFEINGVNESKKTLYYEIDLNHGNDKENKTRYNDEDLRFDLVELDSNGDEVRYLLSNVGYDTLINKRIWADSIDSNTTTEVSRKYKLRMWLSGDVIVSDTDPNKDYPATGYNNYYGNIKITVIGDFTEKLFGFQKVQKAILTKQNAETNSCNPTWTDTEDGVVYFSGTNDCVDMNYVWYSGKLWRITAIYPDGAMKLVTQNNITSIAFSSDYGTFATDGGTTSYAYQWLNEDFYDTLYHANEFIDNSKKWNASEVNTFADKPGNASFVDANVGLLNTYEYYNTYRCIDRVECNGPYSGTGYLRNDYTWYLLNNLSGETTRIMSVNSSGSFNHINKTFGHPIRPSIYIKSNVEFNGDGTITSPYKIIGDKSVGVANDLVNTRLSGEYVKLKNGDNEQLFRIIGIENNKTKIISMDYADNNMRKFSTSTGSINTKWGSGTTTDPDTWYTYLNEAGTGYYDTLKSTYGELFDSGTYYYTEIVYNGSKNYKLSICANLTSGNVKVCDKSSDNGTFNIGLPRYGEMFAVQQHQGNSNSIDMWLMTRLSSSAIYYVDEDGTVAGLDLYNTISARPTLHLKSTVKILSGSGTETDPYVVGL